MQHQEASGSRRRPSVAGRVPRRTASALIAGVVLSVGMLVTGVPAAMAATPTIKVAVRTSSASYTQAQLKAWGATKVTYKGVTYVGVPVATVLSKAGAAADAIDAVRVVVGGKPVAMSVADAKNASAIVAYATTAGNLTSANGPFRVLVGSTRDYGKSTGLQCNPFDLNVAAASSLRTVLDADAAVFDAANNTNLVINYNSSGALQKQIEAGAPEDVFLSAAAKQVNALVSEGYISGSTRSTFASNTLVILTPANNPANIYGPYDLAQAGYLVTGDPATVPHGTYAKEWLTNLGLWSTISSKFVFSLTAAQSSDYIANGDVDAGISFGSEAVNRTDMLAIYVAPSNQLSSILYVGAPVSASHYPATASAFMGWLNGSYFQSQLLKYGFRAKP